MRLFDETGNEVFLYQLVTNAGADQKFYATTDTNASVRQIRDSFLQERHGSIISYAVKMLSLKEIEIPEIEI